jgi:ubiquinone/menaquinone biosynthesis C-methylase UbiE
MKDLKLICPECQNNLTADVNRLYCSNNHIFYIDNGRYNLLPKSMNETTKKDAIYHETQKETSTEEHQIDTLRNMFFRKKLVEFISDRSIERSNILEIGGGVGFDLQSFLENNVVFGNYVFSEISDGILSYVYKGINNDRVSYCCIDSHNIPFGKNQFDFVYMIAALHHFQDTHKALKEIVRVTKEKGFIVFGIEPNRLLLKFIFKIKQPLVKILPKKNHSPADEKTKGFSIKDFRRLEEIYNLKLMKLEPVWLFCGFIHYGLEFLYRLFRLKKRIKLPFSLEKIFICLDRLLYIIPGIKNLCWNYTVIYQKLEAVYLR